MLLLLLPAIFRGKINFPNKIVMYIYPLYAVAAGFVSFIGNNLFYRLMQKLGVNFDESVCFFTIFRKLLTLTACISEASTTVLL